MGMVKSSINWEDLDEDTSPVLFEVTHPKLKDLILWWTSGYPRGKFIHADSGGKCWTITYKLKVESCST